VLQLTQQAYLGSSERALIVLEGWDTAGKGGVVRRLGWALDPRSFKVHPISAPDEHESAEHYLQRFWRHLPQKGQIVVFDRSFGVREPDDVSIKLAIEANDTFIDTLKRISQQTQGPTLEQP
jgi:polyphosphate kinase 2 (PPK2 family)